MSAALEEPSIPQHVQRPLGALWISVGLHAALIALVQVAPPPGAGPVAHVVQARIMNVQVPPHDSGPESNPPGPALLAPSGTPESVAVESVAAEPDARTSARPAHERAEAVPDASGPPVEPPGPAPAEPAAPISLSSSVDLTFYGARELDVQPRALADIVPVYPEQADRQRLSGKVVLELRLEADGRVLDATVVRASPPDVFDAATVAAFEQARFAPPIRNGQPVRAQILIEVTYDWAGRPFAPGR